MSDEPSEAQVRPSVESAIRRTLLLLASEAATAGKHYKVEIHEGDGLLVSLRRTEPPVPYAAGYRARKRGWRR